MFGFSITSAVKSFFGSNSAKKERQPGPLHQSFPLSSGLAPLVVIRDVLDDPFVSLQDFADYLVLLKAFHGLQCRPDWVRLAQSAAAMYEDWVTFSIPSYRRMISRGVFPDTPTDSPTGYSVKADEADYDVSSPLTRLSPSSSLTSPISVLSMISDGSDSTSETLFSRSRRSGSVHVQVGDPDSLPLPPLLILWAWHCHLMRPDWYQRDCKQSYKALKGVPFPLREAAKAIRSGTLPREVGDYGSRSDVNIELGCTGPDNAFMAIQSQRGYIDYVAQSGYLDEGLLDSNKAPGIAAIVRYHGWLEMLATVKKNLHLNHTLDIEMVWKLHRLDHRRYLREVGDLVGIEWFRGVGQAERWSCTSYDDADWKKRTAKLWARRFNGDQFYL